MDRTLLAVRVAFSPLNTPANTPLQQIRFGALLDATATMQSQVEPAQVRNARP